MFWQVYRGIQSNQAGRQKYGRDKRKQAQRAKEWNKLNGVVDPNVEALGRALHRSTSINRMVKVAKSQGYSRKTAVKTMHYLERLDKEESGSGSRLLAKEGVYALMDRFVK
jgi:hypothetical protein